MIASISVSVDVSPCWYEGRSLIDFGVSGLDEKEFDIFNRYFVERCTLKEIGVVYGIGKSMVHRIVKRVRVKVRNRIGREGY